MFSASCSGPQTGVTGQNICYNGDLSLSYGTCCPDVSTGSTSVTCLPDLSSGTSDRQHSVISHQSALIRSLQILHGLQYSGGRLLRHHFR